MFVDERKDKLRQVEQRAKRELGTDGDAGSYHERIKGSFLRATKYAGNPKYRRFGTSVIVNIGIAAVLILFLVAIWKILLGL